MFALCVSSNVQAAELHIASPATVVIPGQTFTVGMGMVSPTNGVVGVDTWLNYDGSLADIVGVATTSASLSTVTKLSGDITKLGFSLLAFDGTNVTSAVKGTWDATQSPLAIITFKAKKVGKIVFTPIYSAGSTTDSNIVSLDTGNPLDILDKPTDQVAVNIAPCILTNDFNYDGNINIVDLMLIATKWGTTDIHYDLNNDQKVDIVDLMLEASKWGTTC